jgi:hypothetical protein
MKTIAAARDGRDLPAFHVHIDGHSLPTSARDAIAETAFEETPFRRDLMCDGFEAPYHYTLKTHDPRLFKQTFDGIVSRLRKTEFAGYVEGECIAYDLNILPRSLKSGSLENVATTFSPLPDGAFRETELHITLRKTSRCEAVTGALRRIGFFSAFMDKDFGLAEILTLQGSKAAVRELEGEVIEFLRSSEEIEHCSIKREDIARFWLSEPRIKRAPILTNVGRMVRLQGGEQSRDLLNHRQPAVC